MKPRVFLDSGIFVAFLDRSDRWHAQARTLFATPLRGWCTSLLVVAEAQAWFLHRLGEEPARRFLSLIGDLEGLEILLPGADHHREVVRTLDRLRGTRLTYVDASSLALIGAHRIRRVWSTDRHLGLTGAEVVPGGA